MINSFTGKHAYLSNMHPCIIQVNGKQWSSLEHAYQAAKTVDPDWQERIRVAENPKLAKRLGQACPKHIGWDGSRVHVMRELLRIKFAPTSQLADLLLLTFEEELVEGNFWHDNYWGSCICYNCSSKQKSNNLGKLLVEVRCELKMKCVVKAI